MFKWKATDRWYAEAAKLEEGYDIGAGRPSLMEKLGVEKKQLVTELKSEYHRLKEREAQSLNKTASAADAKRMNDVKAKIDELEGEEG